MSRKNLRKLKRKKQAETPQEGGEEKKKGFRESWEFRSGRFALRAAAFCIFIGYLGLTGASTINWAHMKWVRSQPLERLPELADRYLNKTFEPEKLNKWVSLRRRQETEDIIRLLMPYTGRLPTFTFLFYSLQLNEAGKTEDALFWWQFARYRARFDALRCGSVMAVENLDSLLQHVPHPEFPPDDTRDSKDVIESLLSVLELDAHYPAENIPEELCTALRAMEPGKFKSVEVPRWRAIRFTLRKMTEYSLDQMREDVKGTFKPKLPPTARIPSSDEPADPKSLIKSKPPERPPLSSSSVTALLASGFGQMAIFLLLLAADRRKEEDGILEDEETSGEEDAEQDAEEEGEGK